MRSRAQSAALPSSLASTFKTLLVNISKSIRHSVGLPDRSGCCLPRSKCEIKLEGEGPWEVPGWEGLQIIHTPGHTWGHCVMYHEPSKSLFTGDHMSFSRLQPGQLRFSKVCAQRRILLCLVACDVRLCSDADELSRLWLPYRTTTGTPCRSRSRASRSCLILIFSMSCPVMGGQGTSRMRRIVCS